MSTYNSNSPRVKTSIARRTLVTSFPTSKGYDFPTSKGYDTKKKVKMGFFRRKFMEWSKRAWEDSKSGSYDNVSYDSVVKSDSSVDSEPQLNFKIYGATGGHVMEFRRYDKKTDRYDNQLYVISTDDDMGERVARIVNMEMMK